ncbi:MAG: energy transducer TonB [bacterium]
MMENRSLPTFIAVSLLMHALLIYLIPKFRPISPEERIGGSPCTQVHLIQTALSPVQKKKARPQAQGDVPAPEIDPKLLERMKAVRDVQMPSFAPPPRPQRKESPPLPHADKTLEDEVIDQTLADEMASQPKQLPAAAPQPPPKPVEDAVKKEESLPKPVPEEVDFGDEEAAEEVAKETLFSSASADIEWSGKPRRILYKPPYPPRYPEGYQGQTQGRIRLKFWVDSQGSVVRVVPMQKLDPRLDVVATEYLRKYRFEPVSKGRGDLEWGIIPFSFRLE